MTTKELLECPKCGKILDFRIESHSGGPHGDDTISIHIKECKKCGVRFESRLNWGDGYGPSIGNKRSEYERIT